MQPINYVWIEKYRPKTMDDMVCQHKDKIIKHLENHQAMPSLLLTSLSPGTGKTSLSKVIVRQLGADVLSLNSSKERGIDVIRNKVDAFVKMRSSKPDVRRIVFLDEADRLTPEAQDALRNLIEECSFNAIFILTGNVVSRISNKLQDRCLHINFMLPDKVEILKRLKFICESEQLEYTDEGLEMIIEKNYPSIRACINVLYELKIGGLKADVDNAKQDNDVYMKLWNKIYVEKDYKFVRDYLFSNQVDIKLLNKFFWVQANMKDNIKMIQITCSNQKNFSGGEELIIFVTSLLDMVK